MNEIVACHHSKAKAASYLCVYDEGWTYVQAYSPRLLDSVILKPGERSASCGTWRGSADLVRDIAGSACPTIAAICSMGHRGPEKHRWYRLWERSSACRSTS